MNFSIIFDNFDYLMFGSWPDGPVGGLALTLILSVVSATLSGVIGLGSGILMVIGNKPVKRLLLMTISFFRAVPILMLMLWAAFLLPKLFGIQFAPLWACVMALSLVGGAYVAHVVAAGLESVAQGQWTAGLALGFNRFQVLRFFILPQAVPRMMPSFINQWVSLIKDTSLVYILSVPEFLYIARRIDGTLTGAYSTEIYLFVGLVYYGVCTGFSAVLNRLSRRYFRQEKAV